MFHKLVAIEPVSLIPSAEQELHQYAEEVTLYRDIPADDDEIVRRIGDADAVLLHFARQAVAAYLQIVGAARLAEEPADLVARRGRLHDVQPVARRRGALLREDFHAVAQLQLVGQRHDGAVHLRAHAVVAHLGVDGVGEIDRR